MGESFALLQERMESSLAYSLRFQGKSTRSCTGAVLLTHMQVQIFKHTVSLAKGCPNLRCCLGSNPMTKMLETIWKIVEKSCSVQSLGTTLMAEAEVAKYEQDVKSSAVKHSKRSHAPLYSTFNLMQTFTLHRP